MLISRVAAWTADPQEDCADCVVGRRARSELRRQSKTTRSRYSFSTIMPRCSGRSVRACAPRVA